MRRTALGLTSVFLGMLLVATPATARSLRDRLGRASQTVGIQGGAAFDALAESIADTAARNLPVLSASSGFTYQYNPDLEIFERTSSTLGPLFLERPDTLGAGKINVNVSFQYVQFDAFDGNDLGGLAAPDPIVLQVFDAGGNPIARRASVLRYNLNIQSYVTALNVTYGVLDALDVNLLVPIVATHLDVGVHTQQVALSQAGGPFAPAAGPVSSGRVHGSATGIGDILVRLKYQLSRMGALRSAAGLQLRLPSGDEDEFQGTGSFELSPFVYLSTLLLERVEPHANLGVDVRTDDVERSQLRWGLGVDVDVVPRVGAALGVLGRNEFSESASATATSFQHLVGGGVASRPLLGVDFDRKDFFDLTFGVRGAVAGNVMVFVNGIYALNDDGLRNETIIPTVGVEGTF